VQRTFEGIIISIKEEKNRYDIYIVSDSLCDIKNRHLSIEISDFYGNPIVMDYKKVNIQKQSSKVYHSISKKSLKGIDLASVYMFIHLDLPTTFTHQTFHFVPMNKLKLPIPEFKFEKTEHDGFYRIESNVYAPYVKIDDFVYEGSLLPGIGGLINVRNKRANYIQYLESCDYFLITDVIRKSSQKTRIPGYCRGPLQ
jgi:hypothetical protein